MSDKVKRAALGAIVGHTLGGPLAGRKSFSRIAFFEPLPQRMSPSHSLDAWVVYARKVTADSDPTQLTALVLGDLRTADTASSIAATNFSRGLVAPASGHFASPLRRSSGSLLRAVYWGLKFPGRPDEAARWAQFDASTDRGEDGVWCAAALARAVGLAEEGTSFVQVVRAVTADLPAESLLHKGISLILQSMGRSDGVRAVQAEAQATLGLADPDDAALALTYALAGVAFAKDFGSAVTGAVGCGGPAADSGAIAGALAAVVFGGVPDDWAAPIGGAYVSGHLQASVSPPQGIEEFLDLVAGSVVEAPIVAVETPAELATTTQEVEEAVSPGVETSTPASEEPAAPVAEEEPPPPLPESAVEAVEPVVTDPAPPECPSGDKLCWIQGKLQVEVTYLNGATGIDKDNVQLIMTVHNFGTDSVTVDLDASSPQGWPVASRLGRFQLASGESTSHGIVCQHPQLLQDSRIEVAVNGVRYTVPVLAPTRWFAAGPFGNDDETAFEKEVPPERSQSAGTTFSGRSGLTVRWEPLIVSGPLFEVEHLFRSGPGTTVLHGRLKFPKPGKTTIVVSGSPGVVVKIDGSTVIKYKDAHVPLRRPVAPYVGTFDALDDTTVLIKLIRDRDPMPPLMVMFLDSLGTVTVPESAAQMPE